MRVLAVSAVAALALVLYGLRLENRFAGALQRDQETSIREWKAKRANLVRAAGKLVPLIRTGDSLASRRSRVSVSLPAANVPGNGRIVSPNAPISPVSPQVVPRG